MSDVPYTVTLEAQGSHQAVTCKLGDEPPTPREGGGGWEEVTLPKRSAVLVWRGFGLLKIDVPVLFDGTEDQVAVAPDYTTLRHMYRPANRESPPPVLSVSVGGGTGIDTIPFLDEIGSWVVSELVWGGAVGDDLGHRVQQAFTVTLTEYVADERLVPTSKKPKKPRPRRYKIERKDIAGGLGKLAHRFKLRDWRVLAGAQSPPRKDPRLTEADINTWLTIPLGGTDDLIVVSSTVQPTTGG